MPFPQPSEQRAAWVYSDRPGGQCAKTLLCRRGFFHEWPAHRQAADRVVARNGEIDGNLYYLLDPVARWLEGAHPLAATLLRRAMIEDTLEGAKSKRYRHAARHLAECQALASLISDYGRFEPHETFVSRLGAKHSRKSGFWTLITDPTAVTASRSGRAECMLTPARQR